MSHLRSDEWEVLVIPDHAEAVDFVRRFHYAGGASNTSTYRHGLYRRDEAHGPLRGPLRGVAMWQPPTKAAAQSVAPGDWRRVLSLSRFAVDEDVPTNGASFLLGRSMRAISRYRWRVLLTYADTGEGHTGAIYRATNWTCLGPVAGGRHVGRRLRRAAWPQEGGAYTHRGGDGRGRVHAPTGRAEDQVRARRPQPRVPYRGSVGYWGIDRLTPEGGPGWQQSMTMG